MSVSHKTKAPKVALLSLAAVVFWVALWAVAAGRVGQELLLPTPAQVWTSLRTLAVTAEFWQTLGWTLLRINAGCALGMGIGIVLGLVTGISKTLDIFLRPIVSVAQSTPVASLIILALVWIQKDFVPVFAAALMTAPHLLANTRQGIAETPQELREMVQLYRVSPANRLRGLYVPQVLPYVLSGCASAIGFGWKAGVAAEVLSIPTKAVGTEIYHSKIYLDTPALFAWTAAVIVLSVILERLVRWALSAVAARQQKQKGGADD
jgi:NitT/TauT family transport system permease protein